MSFSCVVDLSLNAPINSHQTSTVVDGFEDYRTLWPSAIYDIRAVFDGSIINPGFNGYPTIFYTSVTFGPLGAVANETEGVETQSMGKYTTRRSSMAESEDQ